MLRKLSCCMQSLGLGQMYDIIGWALTDTAICTPLPVRMQSQESSIEQDLPT